MVVVGVATVKMIAPIVVGRARIVTRRVAHHVVATDIDVGAVVDIDVVSTSGSVARALPRLTARIPPRIAGTRTRHCPQIARI